VAIVLILGLILLVLIVAALLVMAVGGTLSSVGASLLLRGAVRDERGPDVFGLVLLAGGAVMFLVPVVMAVAVFLDW
jgi:hypothetical protein